MPENDNRVGDLLRSLDQVTNEVCAEKSVTLSKCIPLVTFLLQTVEEYQPCHPRFKKILFRSALSLSDPVQGIWKKVKFKIRAESNASNFMVEEPAPTIPSVASTKINYIWVSFANMAHEKQPGTNNDNAGGFPLEITQYLTRAVSSRPVNPFDEWNDMT
ncbi:uncharacterized protein LOC117169720 [Belonocnema kinseyi]|uniref:uncharacterized protein LOC117169720 n=1 Tax=Belonocnema kinseyi TaxID=2817044 RepID=UPI00143D5BEA|nr:uncharacterized protein LOC117169720 [Belonocnema kinseyi]